MAEVGNDNCPHSTVRKKLLPRDTIYRSRFHSVRHYVLSLSFRYLGVLLQVQPAYPSLLSASETRCIKNIQPFFHKSAFTHLVTGRTLRTSPKTFMLPSCSSVTSAFHLRSLPYPDHHENSRTAVAWNDGQRPVQYSTQLGSTSSARMEASTANPRPRCSRATAHRGRGRREHLPEREPHRAQAPKDPEHARPVVGVDEARGEREARDGASVHAAVHQRQAARPFHSRYPSRQHRVHRRHGHAFADACVPREEEEG